MSFGVYVHIPYCLQRCSYCDFATFEWNKILPPSEYIALVRQEIKLRSKYISERRMDTLYFGGGTPSLVEPELLADVIFELREQGFSFTSDAELTIEINPATLNEENMQKYLDMGINRFSVGAQSFSDKLLQTANRRHSARDTRDTLEFLKKYNLNYTFDLLFALPGQTLADLSQDLDRVSEFSPPHLSAYCLTVPEGHPMSFGRPPEDEQIEMFEMIVQRLAENDLQRYEISNFAKPGLESRHNLLYWTDQSYWGVGLSAHSYSRNEGWGLRFWNPPQVEEYKKSSQSQKPWPDEVVGFERLQENQSLTDFCHISLRLMRGLNKAALCEKFGDARSQEVGRAMDPLLERNLVREFNLGWKLTNSGVLLSNQVFAGLTF